MTITRKKSSALDREAATTAATGKIEDHVRANRERIARMQNPNQRVATVAECQRAEGMGAAVSIKSKIGGRPTGMLTLRRAYVR
jgi:hypothetical protein